MKNRVKYSAAAIILIICGIFSLWPTQKQWWLQPATVQASILQKLDGIRTLVYRQMIFSESKSGVIGYSGYDEIRYCAPTAYRRDLYDNKGANINTQWFTSETDGIQKTEVAYDLQCYFIENDTNGDWSFYDNQLKNLKHYVKLLDQADRIYERREFEGRQCVGFQIDKNKSEGKYNVVWFDLETQLPIRVEQHGVSTSFAGRNIMIVSDRFEFHEKIQSDMFEPVIPVGFVNKHPDQVRREAKGDLVYAGVPQETEEQIIEAVQNAQTVRYRWNYGNLSRIYSVAEKIWRMDEFEGDRHYKTTWYTIQDVEDVGPDIDPAVTIIKTVLYPGDLTPKQSSLDDAPWHPFDALLFHLNFIDQADRILPKKEIEGKWCFGIEISAKKWGDNSDDMIEHWWFDSETYLPVRMEFECDSNQYLQIRDHFEWEVDLSEDLVFPLTNEM